MRLARGDLSKRDLVGAQPYALFDHARFESIAVFARQLSAYRDDIHARDLVFRIGQLVGETRIGREQEKAARRKVESTDRNKPFSSGAQNVVDGRSPFRIPSRSYYVPGLVKEERPPGPGLRRLRIQLDL